MRLCEKDDPQRGETSARAQSGESRIRVILPALPGVSRLIRILPLIMIPRRAASLPCVIAACLLALTQPCTAQMEGWATVRDRDGNRYFVDVNFRTHMPDDAAGQPSSPQKTDSFESAVTRDEPEKERPSSADSLRKPVSVDGLEYYLAQGEELIARHRPADGLYYLKGIKLLADRDPRASSAAMKASKIINDYIRKEKERYAAVDHASALVLIREGTRVTADNGWCGYHIAFDGGLSVVRRQLIERHNYANDSVILGVRSSAPEGKFDALVTISAEIFHYAVQSHDRLEEIWGNKQTDAFAREIIRENEKEVFYSFRGGAPDEYAGFERVIVRGNRGVRVRIFVPAERAGSAKEMIRKVIDSFELRGD